MINPGKPFNIHDYSEIFLRRIWYILISFGVIMSGSVLYAYYSPKEYMATTLILVTPQKVPEQFVMPTVTSKIEDRLQSIGQEIMSRTRLEQIISEFKLYPEEAKSKSKEEIVELMRKNIRVEIKGKEGYFTISYIGGDPKVVTTVTNKLASLFIEENLKLREQQAQGTSEFLSIELNNTKTKLEEQEKAITLFKRQFVGELPEQREANLRLLEQIQLLYQRIGESLRAAQDRRLVIQKQIADTEQWVTAMAHPKETREETPLLIPLPSRQEAAKDPQEIQLEQLRNSLLDLQAKYTERHPDILIVKRRIEELETKIVEAKSARESEEKKKPEQQPGASSTAGISRFPATPREANPRLHVRYQELESQLVATELEIKRLTEEEGKVKALIPKYRDRIENTPAREQAMTLLTRDYQNTKDAYQSLLKKSEEARQAENLERRQKGEQFKILDPGRVPEKPFNPDIPKILLFGFVFGMGGGIGMAFLREQIDRSFRDSEDFEATFGLRVLVNIPKIKTKPA